MARELRNDCKISRNDCMIPSVEGNTREWMTFRKFDKLIFKSRKLELSSHAKQRHVEVRVRYDVVIKIVQEEIKRSYAPMKFARSLSSSLSTTTTTTTTTNHAKTLSKNLISSLARTHSQNSIIQCRDRTAAVVHDVLLALAESTTGFHPLIVSRSL